MKCLTVMQPLAELILRRDKLVENRRWRTHYRGWILIHAGLSRGWLDVDEQFCDRRYGIAVASLDFGAIVGKVYVQDCLTPKEIRSRRDYWYLHNHVHVEGPFCWVLHGAERLKVPIPYRGARMLFDVPDHVLEGAEWIG